MYSVESIYLADQKEHAGSGLNVKYPPNSHKKKSQKSSTFLQPTTEDPFEVEST